jgi:hypothetical protein
LRFLIFIFLFHLSLYADRFEDTHNTLSTEMEQFKIQELFQKNYVALDTSLYSDYEIQDININEKLNQSKREILKDTAYTQLALISAIGVLWVLPESVSKWDKNSIRKGSATDKWEKNINTGPILDEDEFFINYLGHPVSGAIYYSMARNDGLDPFESFLFSFSMSTFFWEYGYESLAEIPSIQDLVSTPVVGAFMGEYMHYLEQELDKNKGLIWGSKYLGNISYAFLDPMGRLAQSLSKIVDTEVTMHYTTYQQAAYLAQNHYNRALNKPTEFSTYNYGFVINFKF